jgi:hypothetical protein
MGDRPPNEQQQHAMQHHAHHYHHHQPVNIPASSLAPLVPPGAAPTTTTSTAAPAPAPTWQPQQQQQQYQYQRPQYQYQQQGQQQQPQTWQQQRRQQPGPPPGMGLPRGQQQGPPPPRGYSYNGRGNGGGRGGGPFPGRQGPGPGRGYNGGGNGGGGRGPPRPRQPRWVATPAEPHDPPAEHHQQSDSQSAVSAFWLDPLPRSADDAAFRAARAALRASADNATADATDDPHRCVYVLRGLPGAGKSTRASALRALAQSRGLECAVHSTDDLCVCPVSGGYLFQAERLPALHDENYSNFESSLQNQIPMVIVDNTNLVAWNYERYVVRAWARGYRVREERVGEFSSEAVAAYAERNVHGVPRERIAQMLEGFLRETEGGALTRAPGSRVGW